VIETHEHKGEFRVVTDLPVLANPGNGKTYFRLLEFVAGVILWIVED